MSISTMDTTKMEQDIDRRKLAISSRCDRLEDRRDDINDDVDVSRENNAVAI
jgi:uncharacterized protein (UPF0335 family)